MLRFVHVVLCPLCVLTVAACAGPATIDEATAGFRRDFSGRVLALDGGRVAYDETFGPARAAAAALPEGVALRFRIGSVTKTFTAAAIVLLHEDGALDLDAPIARFVDDLPGMLEIPSADRITPRHLIEHRSGLADFTQADFRDLLFRPVTPAEAIARVAARPVRAAPGVREAYNNAGYVILGAIVEAASGLTYAEFLRTRLLDPLGMDDTGYAPLDRDVPNLAPPLGADGAPDERAYDHSMIMAAGGLYSTAADLATWAEAVASSRVLPAWYVDDPIGWRAGERFGRPAIWHTGSTNTASALLVTFLDGDGRYVIVSNQGRTGLHPSMRPLARLLFERPKATDGAAR